MKGGGVEIYVYALMKFQRCGDYEKRDMGLTFKMLWYFLVKAGHSGEGSCP